MQAAVNATSTAPAITQKNAAGCARSVTSATAVETISSTRQMPRWCQPANVAM